MSEEIVKQELTPFDFIADFNFKTVTVRRYRIFTNFICHELKKGLKEGRVTVRCGKCTQETIEKTNNAKESLGSHALRHLEEGAEKNFGILDDPEVDRDVQLSEKVYANLFECFPEFGWIRKLSDFELQYRFAQKVKREVDEPKELAAIDLFQRCVTEAGNSDAPDTFCCQKCWKGFRGKRKCAESVEKHVVSHLPMKAYRCPLCLKLAHEPKFHFVQHHPEQRYVPGVIKIRLQVTKLALEEFLTCFGTYLSEKELREEVERTIKALEKSSIASSCDDEIYDIHDSPSIRNADWDDDLEGLDETLEIGASASDVNVTSSDIQSPAKKKKEDVQSSEGRSKKEETPGKKKKTDKSMDEAFTMSGIGADVYRQLLESLTQKYTTQKTCKKKPHTKAIINPKAKQITPKKTQTPQALISPQKSTVQKSTISMPNRVPEDPSQPSFQTWQQPPTYNQWSPIPTTPMVYIQSIQYESFPPPSMGPQLPTIRSLTQPDLHNEFVPNMDLQQHNSYEGNCEMRSLNGIPNIRPFVDQQETPMETSMTMETVVTMEESMHNIAQELFKKVRKRRSPSTRTTGSQPQRHLRIIPDADEIPIKPFEKVSYHVFELMLAQNQEIRLQIAHCSLCSLDLRAAHETFDVMKLRTHVLSHVDERAFECPYCKKLLSHLYNHIGRFHHEHLESEVNARARIFSYVRPEVEVKLIDKLFDIIQRFRPDKAEILKNCGVTIKGGDEPSPARDEENAKLVDKFYLLTKKVTRLMNGCVSSLPKEEHKFSCSKCHRSLKLKLSYDALVKHVNFHQSVKVYACPICGVLMNELGSHFRKNHADEKAQRANVRIRPEIAENAIDLLFECFPSFASIRNDYDDNNGAEEQQH